MASIVHELTRRDVFKVAAAYAVIAWLLVQIADVVIPAFELPGWTLQLLIVVVAIGFPVTVALAWVYDLTPGGVKRALSIMAVFGVVAAAALALSALIGRDRARFAQSAAEQEAAISQEVTDFLISIFEVSDPYSNDRPSSDVTARELLDRGADRILNSLNTQPRVQAQLLTSMGAAYSGLGAYARAEQLLEDALEIRRDLGDSEHVGESLFTLARTLNAAGKYADAQTALEEDLEIQRSVWGDSSVQVARVLDLLANTHAAQSRFDDAREFQQQAIDIRRALDAADTVELARGMNNLGQFLFSVGEYDNAAAAFEGALELYGDRVDGDYSIALANLAAMKMISGRFAEATELHSEALEIKRRVFSEGHVEIAYSLANVAWLLRQEGDLATAERYYEEAIEIFRKTYGEDHGNVGVVMSALAQVHLYSGNLTEAERLYKEALPLVINTFGQNSIRVSEVLNGIGNLQLEQRDWSAAAASFGRVIQIAEALDNDQELPVALAGYASLPDVPLTDSEKERYFLRAIEILAARSQLHRLSAAKLLYARFLNLEGQDRRAFELYSEAIREQATFMRPDHPVYIKAQEEFGNAFDLDAVVRFGGGPE